MYEQNTVIELLIIKLCFTDIDICDTTYKGFCCYICFVLKQFTVLTMHHIESQIPHGASHFISMMYIIFDFILVQKYS